MSFLLFFIIHTSFSKLCFICDISLKSFQRIIYGISIEEPILDGEIELDEMYFKSGLKGRSYSAEIKKLGRKPRKRGLKRHKRGRGTYKEDLCPLLSIIERKGEVYLIPILRADEENIKKEVEKYCDMKRSKFNTDEWKAYNFLPNRHYVTHSIKEYCRDDVHVNTAECNHNLFRIFMSVHMGINKNNLRKYILCYRIMRKAMLIKNREDLILFFISLLVQERKK